MDAPALHARTLAGFAWMQATLARHTPGATAIGAPAFFAAIVPGHSEAPLINSVVLIDRARLLAALSEMAPRYERAGVTGWGLLTGPTAPATRRNLRAAGMALATAPQAMALILAEQLPAITAPSPVAAKTTPDLPTVGRINDHAYTHLDDRIERLLTHLPATAAHAYAYAAAGTDTDPASVALVFDHDTDAVVSFVATVPRHQRQGHATAVMRRALRDAHQRGRITSTLIADEQAVPLYERCGYRTVGQLELWVSRA